MSVWIRTWLGTAALLGGLTQAATAQPATARQRLQTLEKKLPDRPQNERMRDEWANLQFGLRKVRYVLEQYPATSLLRRTLTEQGLAEAERIREALLGGRMPETTYGLREEAYYCDTDGSFQPFMRYLPQSAARGEPLPMIVYLHGYSPWLDIAQWCTPAESLLRFAEEEGFLLLAPFARSNTDFQNIGELDVLQAIEQMKRRFAVDCERIVLAGFSMGGMGAWTIGAHHPEAFAGLLVMAGRGDYYFWHKVQRADMPSYKRDLVDAEFGYSLRDRLKNTPVFILHGSADSLVAVAEARHMAQAVRNVRPDAIYVELPEEDHWIVETAFARADVRKWLRARRSRAAPKKLRYDKSLLPSPAGPVKRAFLDPFVFVCGGGPQSAPQGSARWRRAVREWERYAKAPPRALREDQLPSALAQRAHLLVFGEPETSPLIRDILEDSPVRVEAEHYRVGSRTFPRAGHGLIVVRPHPANPQRIAVAHCGLPWGDGLPDNHKYDFLPDYIVYSAQRDADGSNTALCAGFFDRHWKLDPDRQYAAHTAKDKEPRP
jgi:pimeloyl-ACP methyl ester carboxylesterase